MEKYIKRPWYQEATIKGVKMPFRRNSDTNEKRWKQYEQAQNDTEKQRARDAWDELIDKKKATVASSLDLQDFPRFTYQPSVAKSLKGAIPDLMLLVFANMLLFTLSFVAFIRYDVRSD